MLSWDSIERGLGLFLELVRADRGVKAEFERSRDEFFTAPEAPRAPMAELRHLEWFLLERPSAVLGSTPVQAWQERWRASLPEEDSELATSFLHSLPGAFEVTSLVPGEAAWVRDLFTLGEHPVVEARTMASLAVGDLLVGRLFPAGAGTFLSSPAASVFRNPGLLAAVRADLEGMRSARRGVLRIQQLELERLFHGSGAEPLGLQGVAEIRGRVRAELLKQGLAPEAVAGILERVQVAARASRSQVITEIMNGLAFETGVDLARARLVLVELWDSERQLHSEQAAPVPETLPDTFEEGSQSDARAALAAFDRGRAEGKDLEQLFRDLERDLGIEYEDDGDLEEAEDGAPDFPGVIGAMVEEFLWEAEREHGAERAKRWGVLRALGTYAHDIGVFEDLGCTHLLDFSARWLLDESGLTVAEAEALLEALTFFCVWCEELHDLPLKRQFGATLDSLRGSLPRHLALRQSGMTGSGTGSYRVIRVGMQEALVSDGKEERAVTLAPHQAAHLRSGDLVRLSIERGQPLLGATYPGELRSYSSSAG